MAHTRTYRLTAALVAGMLFFGGTSPLAKHVCAQLGFELHPHAEVVDVNGEEAPPPCHEEEQPDPSSETSASFCCPDEWLEVENTPAVLPTAEAALSAFVATVVTTVDLPDPGTSDTHVLSSRGPPVGPNAPLFILHEALLN